MNHETLIKITADMPAKTIMVNDAPYLTRHYAGQSDCGGQWWYHWFHTADGDRHLHSHPWTATAIILCGKYSEVRGRPGMASIFDYAPGDINKIFPETLHRIESTEPNTWTLLHVQPGRIDTWRFIGDDGEQEVMQTSPEDWWKNCGPRDPAL